MDTNTIQETGNQVIQLFPPEYQPLITTITTIAVSIFGLAMFLWPFIQKWASNRQIAAINDAKLSEEDIANALETKLAQVEKTRLTSELANWKFKLIYATDETRPIIETEIARLEQEYSKYNA